MTQASNTKNKVCTGARGERRVAGYHFITDTLQRSRQAQEARAAGEPPPAAPARLPGALSGQAHAAAPGAATRGLAPKCSMSRALSLGRRMLSSQGTPFSNSEASCAAWGGRAAGGGQRGESHLVWGGYPLK